MYFPTCRCVSRGVCLRKDVVSAPRQEIPITNADLLQHALAEESECSNDNNQICCNQEDISPNKDLTMPEQNTCQMHHEIGYRYIHKQ